ncbi:GH1 family beta-glucosidase [Nocardioides sp. Root151]|uniref:GH1 family beta-glucosidase n=1 Tax=Nocardioides sp. Root151 TaxID=1736475 RepID=UPI000702D525|nr:GH1 family beta-glucosidase [Nocardioides sp. Root151]KQZ76346.1 beta-glucosidase [Nocardioides sp. Root151]
MSIDLPPGFSFGASTAAYQIEGAVAEGGRGRSIWDTFCAEPSRIVDGSSGAEACDHYHRYAEEVALLKGLGVDGYRLSIAWPRIQPTGTGAPNAEGIAFYDRLLDELLGAGIDPMVTLYHWDLPQALEDDGGWLNRATAERFSEYAAICGERFGDRVRQWVPVNEPNVASLMGYALGMHAPGKTLMFDALPACHHLLLAHGLGTQALRGAGVGEIGCANNHAPMWPASDGDGDLAATGLFDDLWNNLFADPMLLGEWPEDLAPLMEPLAREGDLATINQPLDFYGVNYYNPYLVAAAAEGAELPFEYRDIEGYPTTDFGWPVVPDGLREQLVTLHRRYTDLPPVVITESGCAYNLGPDETGVVDDRARIDYLDSHLRAVADAIAEGVDVRGYFTWSIIDNFEWSEGYTQRFGLVHVDYDTQQRTPKKSYDWYRAYIAAAGQDR